MSTNHINIYCDGSCLGNPGAGGWAVLVLGDRNILLFDGVANSTSNRMELQAAIKSVEQLHDHMSASIYTDSQYVVKGMNEWRFKWAKNNWMSSSGSGVANKDLWLELIQKSASFKIDWNWVKGHSNNKANNMVDEAAHGASKMIAKYVRSKSAAPDVILEPAPSKLNINAAQKNYSKFKKNINKTEEDDWFQEAKPE